MITLRKAEERGHADHGWLNARHSFSFANYYDPEHMGYGPLRVLNDDHIAASGGFGTHPHKNMEIITYLLDGQLAHKDSMGNGSTITPGDVQRMSAGSGVFHSEFNPSEENGTHLLQIWIQPNVVGGAPGYEQKRFERDDKLGKLRLIASEHGELGSVKIQQDARVYAALLEEGHAITLPLSANRLTYVHLAQGQLTVNNEVLHAGDAVKLQEEAVLSMESGKKAEVLVFDLPFIEE